MGKQIRTIPSEAMEKLVRYPWPESGMPGRLQALSPLVPLTHLLELFWQTALAGGRISTGTRWCCCSGFRSLSSGHIGR